MIDYSDVKQRAEEAKANWENSGIFRYEEVERFINAANPDFVLSMVDEIESLREALRLAKPCVERDMRAAVRENFGIVGNDPWAGSAVDARDAIVEALK